MEAALLPWCGIPVLTALRLSFNRISPGWSASQGMDAAAGRLRHAVTDAVVSLVQPGFRALSALLDLPMRDVRLVLPGCPGLR